jgi:arylsulfatase A
MLQTLVTGATRCGIALAATAAFCSIVDESPAAERPNVIVILTDDQGTIDAKCFGATDLVTPGIDSLAQRGVRLTQFYAAAPVCSPSRAGLLTGRYPVRAGVPGNVSSQKGGVGMPSEQITMAETFKAAGYATAHVGKWHLGYTPQTMPGGQGFDFSFGHMGGCIDNFSHFFYWRGPNRHDLWRQGEEVYRDGRFFPDLMVEEAVDFITENQQRPFFMYFAMNTPHYPYQGDVKWLEYYQDLAYPRNLYAAFVTTLDARIKTLVDAVDELNLRERTIIVFQSDHGHSTEQRAHHGGGNAGPHRGAKFSLFEGGIRVPAVISWPGSLSEGAVRDQMAHSCDWLPTLAELCGVKLLNDDVDGRSLVKVLKSETAESPHDVLHWTIGGSWAVRQGPWKLLGNPRDTGTTASWSGPDSPGKLPAPPKLMLVNIEEDPSEKTDRSSQEPEVFQKLKAAHDDWAARLR